MNRTRTFLAIGLLASLLLAGVVSYYASSSPDGLEKVATEKGIDTNARDHDLAGSPLADYSTRGITDARLSGGLAGVVGVLITFGIAGSVALVTTKVGRRGTVETTPVPPR